MVSEQGDPPQARVVLLARCWGMGASGKRMLAGSGNRMLYSGDTARPAEHGFLRLQRGRKSCRWILSTPAAAWSHSFALHTRPIGSRMPADKLKQ